MVNIGAVMSLEILSENAITGKNINDYNIIKYLSSGSFGDVYLGEKDDKLFAIKVFKEAYLLDEYKRNGENNRIKREIDIIKSVSNKYLIAYEDDFTYEYQGNKHYCLVMEYFQGQTLREYIDNMKTIDESSVISVFIEILKGISTLHNYNLDSLKEYNEYGIIHRDLKPENIMIDATGNIKILDFGVSKIIDYTSITATGDRMGTWSYMSPEQIIDSKHITKISDIYSLGVIFYELLTKSLPYSETDNLPALIKMICDERPIPPRTKNPNISNEVENVILKMLEKLPYNRFNSIETIIESLKTKQLKINLKTYDTAPRFVLRLYNEKTVLNKFIEDGNLCRFVEFPANLQTNQKGLLKLIQSNTSIIKIIDPATIRLAYGSFQDNKGMLNLPYAPENLKVITPDYLSKYRDQHLYVKNVLDEEARLGANILLSPFHYTNNSSIIPTVDRNPIAEWLDLDIKLLREAIDYKNNSEELNDKELYAGICLHADSLMDDKHRNYILNTFAAMNCDGYLVYANSIDNSTSANTLYHYIKTLKCLQENTQKPVIAGRINPLGLGLICAGISGFSSGAAQFDKFSEDLYLDTAQGYNLYERYYIPQLLSTVGIMRKDPSRLKAIIEIIGHCGCPYCNNKDVEKLTQDGTSKLHFLYLINKEIQKINSIPNEKKIDYFLYRITVAIETYKKLKSIFLPKEYAFLNNWKKVFEQIKNDEK